MHRNSSNVQTQDPPLVYFAPVHYLYLYNHGAHKGQLYESFTWEWQQLPTPAPGGVTVIASANVHRLNLTEVSDNR